MEKHRSVTVIALLVMLLSITAQAQTVTRGPYLQSANDDAVTVRWRTDVATDSVVRYGATAGNLDQSASVGGSTTEHGVRLTGLAPSSQYFYSVGNSAGAIAGDSSFHFKTSPVSGTAADARIWVIGDSGTANANARAVRDAFKAYSSSDEADLWIMLGDNAYNDGTDLEYQAAVFDTYPELLRQLPLWPTLGNHDGHSADSSGQSGPYYDIFDLPVAGEAGGLASGTEAYHSFDYGNIHFINLDSYETDRSPNGNMLLWLESDLATNNLPWVIAFFHHPPYTKGSHNSDTEGRLIDMRQNALPILEAWGVDLVLSGHSHSYERSYLLDSHYGASTTLDPDNEVLDPGDGDPAGDGAYEKPDFVRAYHEGAVYAVAGSSGKVSTSGSLNHPAMFVSMYELGSMVLDVAGNQLDAVFIDETGAVRDGFTILKTPDIEPPLIASASAEDANHVLVEYSEHVDSLSAADPANYVIGGLSISFAELLNDDLTVRLTTSTMTAGAGYTLTVNNVMDESGNTILANSQKTFSYIETVAISFQDGLAPTPAYGGTSDSTIRQATPTTIHGLEATIRTDSDDPSGTGQDMSMLLRWDISDIPTTATVESASFQLEVTNTSGGGYGCFALLRDWDQAEATWNEATSGVPWGAPGAFAASDRDTHVLCTVVASSTGPLTVQFTAAGLSLLQSWISGGANNYGMIITSDTTSDGADFHSSESTSAMSRPKLNVVYSTPPVPVNLPPMAAFGESCTDLDCNFTDASTDTDGSVVSWSWDFGDGNNSSLQNPSHTYLAAGSYSVTLTATDDGGLSDISSHPVMVTAPNVAPTAAFSESCTDLDCNFTDASTDSDGSVVSWSWNFGDGNSSSERNPSHTFAGANTYTVSLTVTDNDGATGFSSKPVTVEEASVPVDNLAAADLVGSGTVTGDFTVTHVDDDLTQMIRERESGGKKNNRHSFLEHSWRFDLVPGATATVLVNAWGSVSSDGDNFVFAWSADNDQFTDLFTVDSIDDDIIQTAMITGPVSGSVYLRVRDTNRTQGNRALDTVFIDSLVVRTESAAGEPPAAPDSVSAVATGPDRIFVDWADKSNDELGFEIQVSENGSSYDPAGSVGPGVTNYLDTGLTGLTTYWYQVRAFNASGNSAWTTAVSATTEAPPDISLSLAGSKQRGQHVVTLTWSGITGGSVDIHRDGPFLLSTSNDGNHVDNTGNKGGRTYTYKVCEAGTEICSALVSITF